MSYDKDPKSGLYRKVALPMLNAYVNGMGEWLSEVYLGRPETNREYVKVVYATPERAYAKAIAPNNEGQTDIPIISFYFTGMVFNQQRGFLSPSVPFARSKVGDTWRVSQKPTPWDISFSVSGLFKTFEDADQFFWSIMSRFTPKSYMSVEGLPMALKIDNSTDTSEIEPGQDKDRIVRRDLIVSCEGWVFYPFEEIAAIKAVMMELTPEELNCRYSPENNPNREIVVKGEVGAAIELVHPWRPEYDTDPNAKVVNTGISNILSDNQEAAKIITREEER